MMYFYTLRSRVLLQVRYDYFFYDTVSYHTPLSLFLLEKVKQSEDNKLKNEENWNLSSPSQTALYGGHNINRLSTKNWIRSNMQFDTMYNFYA